MDGRVWDGSAVGTLQPSCMEMEMRAVIVRPGEDSGWVVECPSLPGCISQGQTKGEAIANRSEEHTSELQSPY